MLEKQDVVDDEDGDDALLADLEEQDEDRDIPEDEEDQPDG